MGLSPDILNKLLVVDDHSLVLDERDSNSRETPEDELIEFEFESEEGSPSVFRYSHIPLHHQPQEVLFDPVLEDGRYPGTDNLHPHPHKFRLRLLSETSLATGPCSVRDLITAQSPSQCASSYQDGRLSERRGSEGSHRSRRVVKRAVGIGHGGIKAEYVVTGENLCPL